MKSSPLMVGLDFCSGPCSHLHSPSRDASRKPAWSPWSLRLAASLSRPSPWVCDFLGGSLESHLSMKMLSSHWSGLLTFPRPLHVQVTPRQATRPQNASHACPVRPFLITTTQALCTHPWTAAWPPNWSLCVCFLLCFDFGCLPYILFFIPTDLVKEKKNQLKT